MARYRQESYDFGAGWSGTYKGNRVSVLRAEGWLSGPLIRTVRDDGVIEVGYPFIPDETDLVISTAAGEERVPYASVSELRPEAG